METSDIEFAPRHCDMMVKVCGMRDPDNIRMVAALAPMLMGFIFWEGSVRSANGLDPEVIKQLPSYIRPVALFVNPGIGEVRKVVDRYGFKIVQLHGDESPEFCDLLRSRGLVVFKALNVATEKDIRNASIYDGHADILVLDAKTGNRGGSGKKFNWDILTGYTASTPYLLSGGIGPDDVDKIVSAMRRPMAGIDINSRFETAPGIKDVAVLTKFLLTLRQFNEDESIATPFWEKTK